MCYIGLEFTESRPLGATWALDALWNRLGIGAATRRLIAGQLEDSAERVLFALVANRALAPSSKPAAARWVSEDVIIRGLPTTTDDACYRVMCWLLEVKSALETEISDRITGLRDQELELLFFDTAATYPEAGVSQVVGLAVTREGIPLRAWSWPENIADSALIRQVRADMWGWVPSRMAWVADRGGTSAEGRRYLREGGNDYIIGEKMRPGSAEAATALSQPGRYQKVTANLRVKEVRVSADERLILCHDTEGAERDAALRAQQLAQLDELIRDTDALSRDMRAEKLRGFTFARHSRHGYLRITAGGRLRINAKAVRDGKNQDGKYLLRTSDPAMTAEDIALSYRRLLDVERSWRDMNQVIDLRPGHGGTEEGVRAHVLLCWLALLLARVAENACQDTWARLHEELDRMAIGTFTGPAGVLRQRTEITSAQLSILAKLAIDPPPRICQFTPAASVR